MRMSHYLHRPADLRVGGLRSCSSFWAASRFSRLPVAQYPEIAPPIINITGQYPGASAETVAETVVAPIEQQVNGVEGMLYLSSNSTADGRFTISVTFDIGVNLDIAQVQVQNRVATAHAASAAAGAADRRAGREKLARHPDAGEPLFARQVARPAVHLELRQYPDQGRADPRRRRRFDHGVRCARLCDAGLARSGPDAVAQPHCARCHARAAGPERAGRLRRAEPAADAEPDAPFRSRCARSAVCPIPRNSAISSSSRPAMRWCACAMWRGSS